MFYEVPIVRIKWGMSEMIWFFNYSSNPKMLVFTRCSNSAPATGLSVLTYLAPAAISGPSLSPALSRVLISVFSAAISFHSWTIYEAN